MKKFDDRSTTTVVTEESVPVEAGLTAEEERVLRMRSGASLGAGSPLTSKLEGVSPAAQAEVSARLALIEASLLGLLDDTDDDDPARVARKQRIVDALRDQDED